MLMQKYGNQISWIENQKIVNHGITLCHNGIIINNPKVRLFGSVITIIF
jgi:hypothetical protein